MAQAKEQQYGGPDDPRPIEDSERYQHEREPPRQLAVLCSEESEQDVAAIQLADGQQVDGCGQESGPGGARDGVKGNVTRIDAGEADLLDDSQGERRSESEVAMRCDAPRGTSRHLRSGRAAAR